MPAPAISSLVSRAAQASQSSQPASQQGASSAPAAAPAAAAAASTSAPRSTSTSASHPPVTGAGEGASTSTSSSSSRHKDKATATAGGIASAPVASTSASTTSAPRAGLTSSRAPPRIAATSKGRAKAEPAAAGSSKAAIVPPPTAAAPPATASASASSAGKASARPPPAPAVSPSAPPLLSFDSPAELDEVITRVREHLEADVRKRWRLECGEVPGVEDAIRVVHALFWDELEPKIKANCAVKGVPFAHYVKSRQGKRTQPFSEVLHDRVLRYQAHLFSARWDVLSRRHELPLALAGKVARLIATQEPSLEALARQAHATFPSRQSQQEEEEQPPQKKRRTTTTMSSSSAGGGDAQSALVAMTQILESAQTDLDELVEDVPAVLGRLARAIAVSHDVRQLVEA